MLNLTSRMLVITLTSLLFTACGGEQEEPAREPVIRPVKVIEVNNASNTTFSRLPAVIGAWRMSDLSMQVSGLILELPISEAQQVKQGDLIAKLDPRDFESQLASAKAQYTSAEVEYQRALKLSKQDAIARNVLEQRALQRDVAKAQFDSAQKALGDTVLRAPFDGVIAEVPVKKLLNVSGGTVVARIMDTEMFKATIDLPASFIAQIPKDEDPEASPRKAFVVFDAVPNQLIEATFKEASLVADTASQTYAVTFTFMPPNNLNILPGMNASVEIRTNGASDTQRIAVPMDAVLSDGQNRYVWIISGDDMTVSKQSVEVEEGVGETIVITDGLKPGQRVVGAGASYLSEGMQVREWKK